MAWRDPVVLVAIIGARGIIIAAVITYIVAPSIFTPRSTPTATHLHLQLQLTLQDQLPDRLQLHHAYIQVRVLLQQFVVLLVQVIEISRLSIIHISLHSG